MPLPDMGEKEPPALVVQRMFTNDGRVWWFNCSVGKSATGTAGVVVGGGAGATGATLVIFLVDAKTMEVFAKDFVGMVLVSLEWVR